jgi:hypothetical protein
MPEHDYAEYLADAINGTIRGGWLDRMALESDYDEPEDVRVRWQTDGTTILEGSRSLNNYGHYRVTVIVEPAESWQQVTWRDVAERTPENVGPRDIRPLVSLGGVEAVVLSAAVQRWHVKPGTGDAKWNPPVAQEHDVVAVRLQVAGQEPKTYTMPPTGPVMLLSDSPTGPALAALVHGGLNPTPVEEA